jgi:enediyne biosynthesis protein E11
MPDVFSDLTADAAEVDLLVEGLDESRLALSTPAPGWTIAHQIAHLTAVFRMAGLAAADPAAFRTMLTRLSGDFTADVDAALSEFLGQPPGDLVHRWRTERQKAVTALAAVPDGQTVPWLADPLPPAMLAAAGLMELFGHGQDIADTLGVTRQRTDRLGHLVAFAVRTRDFGYLARNLAPPEEPFRFEIEAPSGTMWQFGPADAKQTITGPAGDFCLLVTRRRHCADLGVVAHGDKAAEWLRIAQAYRGPAGQGRAPGQFAAALR